MEEDEPRVLGVPGVEVADLSMARWFVRRHLGPVVPDTVVKDLELVVSELLTNAWAHAAAPASVSLGVSVAAGRATVTVESTSSMPSFVPDVAEWSMAAPDELSGRGLGVVRKVADDIDVEQHGQRLVISVHRILDPRPARVGATGGLRSDAREEPGSRAGESGRTRQLLARGGHDDQCRSRTG